MGAIAARPHPAAKTAASDGSGCSITHPGTTGCGRLLPTMFDARERQLFRLRCLKAAGLLTAQLSPLRQL